jgi:hypothetical protein
MKIAELLRAMLDQIDNAEVVAAVPHAHADVQNMASPEQVTVDSNVADPEDLFLPPLQMKLELLKKAVGVENVYDNGSDADQEEHSEVGAPDSESDTSFEQELSSIKRAAGINPVVMSELSDDEPLDS